MPGRKAKKDKKYYTVAEANAALPLVKAIVRDITELASDLRERQGRLRVHLTVTAQAGSKSSVTQRTVTLRRHGAGKAGR